VCDAQVQSGGNEGGDFAISVGTDSGHTRIFYQTYGVADEIVVRDASGNQEFTTGCVATDDHLPAVTCPAENLIAGFNGCCSAIERVNGKDEIIAKCWNEFDFSTSGGLLEVVVKPNCSGTPNTFWAFKVVCPDD
jgi:hypothetical protein